MFDVKIGLFLEADLSKTGGVQEYVRGLYDYLKSRGHKVCIITPGQLAPGEEKREVKILGTRLELEGIAKMIGSSASMALTYAKIAKIERFLTRENFDLLHFQAPFGLLGYEILWLLQKQKIAKVATFLVFRESNLIPLLVNNSIGPILRRLTASFDGQIALSQAAEEFAQKMFPGKYLIIPSGVDLKRFKPKGTKVKKYSDEKKNLLFVGRLDYRKGILILLKAFLRVKRKNSGVRLIIVGSGPKGEKARKFAEKQRIRDVEFEGFIERADLPKFYRTADIVCFPSLKDESFGIVLLEAMAAGKPVVASKIKGYREVLKGDLGRLLVPPGDVGSLAVTLLALLENESLRRSYGQKSLETVKEYSWEKIGAGILKVYKTIVDKKLL